ncbi:MAG: hypothetical protein CL908_01570 [Deltaproteobacteria bacterium]|nr:hypothetical protein [Deltaproteobacteria bacterium]
MHTHRRRLIVWNFGWGRVGFAAILLFLASSVPRPALGQYVMIDDEPPRFEWRGRVESDFRSDFETDTDGGDEFESWQLGLVGDFGGPINESILVGLRTGYRYADYDFRLDNGPGRPSTYGTSELPRDPWGSVNTFDFTPSTTVLVGSRFSVIGAVPIRWAGESGARRNGFAAGISGLVRWQVTDSFRIGAGIGLTSQLEDGAETFPIVSLDWRISETLSLRTEGSWVQGGNAVLLFGASKHVRLTASVGYERTRFRLDDNGFEADRDGIGEITAVPIEVGVRFRLFAHAILDFRAGLGVAGRFRVESDDGDKLYDEDYDPSPRIGLGLTIPFGLPGAGSGS